MFTFKNTFVLWAGVLFWKSDVVSWLLPLCDAWRRRRRRKNAAATIVSDPGCAAGRRDEAGSRCPAVRPHARSASLFLLDLGADREEENHGDVGTGVGSPSSCPARCSFVDSESHLRRQPASQPRLGAGSGGGGGQRGSQPQLPENERISPHCCEPRPERYRGGRWG